MRDPLLTKITEAYIQMEDDRDLEQYWTGLVTDSGEVEDFYETGRDGEREEKPSFDSPGEVGWFEVYYDVIIKLTHRIDDAAEYETTKSMGPEMFKKVLWSDEVIQAGKDSLNDALIMEPKFRRYIEKDGLRYDNDDVELLSVEEEGGKIVSMWKVKVTIDGNTSDNYLDEEKPGSHLSAKERSDVVKKAKKGEDIGKKGKGFKKVASAAKKSGADDPEAVAAAAMWKNVKKESLNEGWNFFSM